MPGPPPTSNNRPHEPLCALRGRRGSARFRSSSTSRSSGAAQLGAELRRQLEPRELELAAMIDRGAEEQALLQPEERHGRRRAHGHGVRPPGIRIEAARDVERQHRRAGGVDRVDRRAEVAADGRARPVPSSASTIDVGAVERPRLERGRTRRRRRGSRRRLAPPRP